MGISAVIQDIGYQVESIRSVGADGRIAANLGVDAFRRATDGRYTSLPRGDLAATIYAAIEESIEAIFGDSISALEDHSDGVRLTFERGHAREFDLVIGADGLHSNVRRLVFGPDGQFEHYLGCMVAAGVVDGYRPRDELVYMTHNCPGRSVARFSLRDDRTLVLFVYLSDHPHDDDPEAGKARLRREFADVGWECPQILAALDDADDLYFDVVSQIRLDRWSRSRVALIGDAAACVSLLAGEGTGLAMTEAYVLAGELLRAKGDHLRAFDAYDARLRQFVDGKQSSAKKYIPIFATRTWPGIRFRNLCMRAMNFNPVADLLVGRRLRDTFVLPDYDM
jgi:2-polyprenyl-6-methoxyphenol hydroxylase-like FAD-dependent oxidoreductase